jgi:NAD+ diphosphatase
MTGCIAQAVTEDIFLGHDPELTEARWFTKEEVKKALSENSASPFAPVPKGREGELRLPPSSAIAHVLLKAFVEDTWGIRSPQ